jgi:hypothetical protein
MTAQKRNSNVISVGAPIGGWNIRDPLPMMSPEYAPQLDNVFCLPSEIQIRKGYIKHATFTGICRTLLEYNALSGSQKLFAAVDNAGACSIQEVTSGGAAVSKVTGLNSAKFKQTNIATSGGDFAYYVNGVDPAVLYNGTTFYSVTSVSTPYAITGPTSTAFSDVVLHKRRLWFVEPVSMKCWYLPTDQIAGAAVAYDFGPLFTRGGKIVKIDTWSLDAGTGLDDYFIVFTSMGEVGVFQGVDPASASTWSLTGVFFIGSPTAEGYTQKFGGDLLVINRDGIAQMSKSLMSSRVNTKLQLTDKIQPQLASDTTTYQSISGWDIELFPPENMLIVNIPINESESYQYVMNTISGGWARWKGINAKCWKFQAEKIFFGADGYVGRAWIEQSDDGSEITADILPAYQNYGSQSRLKRFSMGRIVMGTTSQVSYGSRMEVDFNLRPGEVSLPFVFDTAAGLYGTATYGTSVYAGNITIKNEWKNVSGMGYWGSLHIKVKTKVSDVRIYSYDLNIESGGNI